MDKAAIVYWSGTGNTEAMANAIAAGMREAGAEVDLYTSDVAPDVVLAYNKIAFGCPSMGAEVLEESEFEPLFASVEAGLSGKKVALFGSYGWGDGEWMRSWAGRTQDDNADLYGGEGFIQNEAPDEAECTAFGRAFAAY